MQNHLRHFLLERKFIINKNFKKIAAALMAATTLAGSIVGMGANAERTSDSSSIFDWNKNGSYVSVALTNTSGKTRYAKVNVYGYDATGKYVNHIGNSSVLDDGENVSSSGTIYAVSYVYEGYLYCDGTSYSPTYKTWIKSK